MNRDEAIRRAEIAMAWARGETVQHQEESPQKRYDWKDLEPDRDFDVYESPLFFAPNIDWRLKPKPLECWVWVPDDSEHSSVVRFQSVKPSGPFYDQHGILHKEPGRWVRMVEKQ